MEREDGKWVWDTGILMAAEGFFEKKNGRRMTPSAFLGVSDSTAVGSPSRQIGAVDGVRKFSGN